MEASFEVADNLDVDKVRGETIYQCGFAVQDAVSNWVMEGEGSCSFDDGWMTIASTEPDSEEGRGNSVFWCPEDFPADFIAEWDIQPLSEHGLCIVFFAAKGIRGESIFDPSLNERNGIFCQYTRGDINSYHISYYANTPFNPRRATSNLRKNSGFHLVSAGPPGIPAFSRDICHVALIKQSGRILLGVDGKKIIDYVDDGKSYGPILQDGKIGFRQMRWMTARYRNFNVYNIAK